MSTSNKEYVMKDSPPELVSAAGVQPQGRKYDKSYTSAPGAVRIEDVVIGMKYASLAITDDKPNTLKKIGKSNPWQIEALKIITGSKEEAHKPLSYILPTHLGLECDAIIDESGVAKNGQILDTQGYIAHNDTTIVLAYRCTTSAKDWLTNFSTTSSAWEPEEDLEQGHSGFCSGFEGLCCNGEDGYRPRVHTGFYNNFLVTLPYLKEHILPLLGADQPPRKLYVVGHSLGAGIATLAACYFLLHVDWETLPHTFLALTAGSPRAVQQSMKDYVTARMDLLRPLDKAVVCRVVRDRDVVPTLPPEFLGFRHLDKLVYITDDGEVLINPKLKGDGVLDEKELQELVKENPEIADELEDDDSDSDDEDEGKSKRSKYDKLVAKIPAPFRDHMPDFYLVPLIKLFENETGIPQSLGREDDAEEEESASAADPAQESNDRGASSAGGKEDETSSTHETSSSSSRSASSEEESSTTNNSKGESGNSSKIKKTSSALSGGKNKLVKMFSRKKKTKKSDTAAADVGEDAATAAQEATSSKG